MNHLNRILPLKARQDALSRPLVALHWDILAAYVTIGRTLNRDEIAQRVADVDEAVQILKQSDLVVFNEHGEPIGAYPFTMEPREYQLTVKGHQVHCMCALDALAVSPMFDVALEIKSTCRVTGEAITLKQKRFDILNASEVQDLFFGINWNAASSSSCCADTLCTEMIFLKGDAVAHDWRDEDPENKQIFALNEAIEFAARFFMPLVVK
ncbi:MAG: organomercurial lyase [Ardenticatenaceae bacterium]